MLDVQCAEGGCEMYGFLHKRFRVGPHAWESIVTKALHDPVTPSVTTLYADTKLCRHCRRKFSTYRSPETEGQTASRDVPVVK